MPRNPDRQRVRRNLKALIHLLVVVLGWVGFVWMWVLVAARPWESQRLVWLILGSLIVAPVLTGAWVLHNRALYRRKGERRALAQADDSYARDWHGREVRADWAVLRRSRDVVLSVDGNVKRYLRHAEPAPVRVKARTERGEFASTMH